MIPLNLQSVSRPQGFYTVSKLTLTFDPATQNQKGSNPLIIRNLHVKFESVWTKTAVCIVSKRFYT